MNVKTKRTATFFNLNLIWFWLCVILLGWSPADGLYQQISRSWCLHSTTISLQSCLFTLFHSTAAFSTSSDECTIQIRLEELIVKNTAVWFFYFEHYSKLKYTFISTYMFIWMRIFKLKLALFWLFSLVHNALALVLHCVSARACVCVRACVFTGLTSTGQHAIIPQSHRYLHYKLRQACFIREPVHASLPCKILHT